VLHGIILESQNAFVIDRQILDFVLVASECLDSRLKAEIRRVLCKLDVEITFDHMSWDFLMYLEMQVFKNMEEVDNVLYFYCSIFYFDKWQS